MGDALADPVIGGDEGALRRHRDSYGAGDPPHQAEQWADLSGIEILDRLPVVPGHHQNVAGEQRSPVQEGDAVLALVDAVRLGLAGDDLAEDAGLGADRSTSARLRR